MFNSDRKRKSKQSHRLASPAFDMLDQRTMLSATAIAPDLSQTPAIVGSAASGMTIRGEKVIKDITYTHHGSRKVQLDLYLPIGTPPAGGWPVILAFPGGGWRQANRKDYGGAVSVFTHFGYAVACVDYTYAARSGGSSWPTNLQDARSAVVWVHHFAKTFSLNADKIVAMGESSGAHIALLLGTYPDGPIATSVSPGNTQGETYQGVSTKISAIVDFYGPTNLAELYQITRPAVDAYIQTFLGGSPSKYPDRYTAASPITYINPKSPPTLTVQGLADPTVKPSQSLELDAALTDAGVRHTLVTIPWARHGFRFKLGSYNFVPLIRQFLDGALNGGPIPASQQVGT